MIYFFKGDDTMESEQKKEIINLNKGDFLDFIKYDFNGEIVQVFDDEGVSYLKQYSHIENRISYILAWSKYADELFYNKSFLDLFLSTDISYYYASLSNLNNKTCDLIINRCKELNKDVGFIGELVSYFSKDYQLKFIDEFDYPSDIIYELFKKSTSKVGAKILKKFNIDLLSHGIQIRGLVSEGKNLTLREMAQRNNNPSATSYDVSPFYLSSDLLDKRVAEHLWNVFNVYEYRILINDAYHCGDPSVLNKYAKIKEEEFILSNDYKEPYKSIINLIFKLSKLDASSEEYYDSFIKLRKKLCVFYSEYEEFNELLANQEFNKAIDLVKQLVNEKKSDYIIDYHFEENYYNIMYDLRELLDFYYAGNISIPEDRLYIYQQIDNIDMLSEQEKLELHNTLKNYNMIELFYEDMSFARKIVRQALKDNAMVKEELMKYRDDELSRKYGVDVYNLKGKQFCVLVKTGVHEPDKLPVGHSFSLIGNGCVCVFGNLSNSNTFVYDTEPLNPEQIVHIFPDDSFTLYQPFNYTSEATTRVEQLVMTDELLYETKFYNEILILEQGYEKTDIDSKIPKLERVALVCADQITDKNVAIAKEDKVGIMLVDSKGFDKTVEMPRRIYRHLGRNDYEKMKYIRYGIVDELVENKKKR